MASQPGHSLSLFSRRPQELVEIAPGRAVSLPYAMFPEGEYDAIVNFVGSGDPARIAGMGGSILEITYEFDSLALGYLRRHPGTRYIFLSSGAAYGQTFDEPAGRDTPAGYPINDLKPGDFYAIAKLHAECRHRALPDARIIDIRIFNYFSRTADIAARFLMTDIVRAIRRNEVLQVGVTPMSRDFLTPPDFAHLIDCALDAPPANLVLDAYSRAPVEKFALLERMSDEFGLRYDIVPAPPIVQATGAKPQYYSTNHRAAELGYEPAHSSIDGVVTEARALFQHLDSKNEPP